MSHSDKSFTDLVAKLNAISEGESISNSQTRTAPAVSDDPSTQAMADILHRLNTPKSTITESSVSEVELNLCHSSGNTPEECTYNDTKTVAEAHKYDTYVNNMFIKMFRMLETMEQAIRSGGLLDQRIDEIGGNNELEGVRNAIMTATQEVEEAHMAATAHINEGKKYKSDDQRKAIHASKAEKVYK